MTEHLIRITSIHQVAADGENGSITISQLRADGGRDLFVLEFADDEFSYDLMETLSAARKWRIEAAKARASRYPNLDDACGGGDYPPYVSGGIVPGPQRVVVPAGTEFKPR